ARVRLTVRLPQALGRHVRVQLRGAQRGMPEDLLDTPQVRAALQQVRRRAVPQPVRPDVGQALLREPAVQRTPYDRRMQPPRPPAPPPAARGPPTPAAPAPPARSSAPCAPCSPCRRPARYAGPRRRRRRPFRTAPRSAAPTRRAARTPPDPAATPHPAPRS